MKKPDEFCWERRCLVCEQLVTEYVGLDIQFWPVPRRAIGQRPNAGSPGPAGALMMPTPKTLDRAA